MNISDDFMKHSMVATRTEALLFLSNCDELTGFQRKDSKLRNCRENHKWGDNSMYFLE